MTVIEVKDFFCHLIINGKLAGAKME